MYDFYLKGIGSNLANGTGQPYKGCPWFPQILRPRTKKREREYLETCHESFPQHPFQFTLNDHNK